MLNKVYKSPGTPTKLPRPRHMKQMRAALFHFYCLYCAPPAAAAEALSAAGQVGTTRAGERQQAKQTAVQGMIMMGKGPKGQDWKDIVEISCCNCTYLELVLKFSQYCRYPVSSIKLQTGHLPANQNAR